MRRQRNNGTIVVKVGRLGEPTQEIEVEEGVSILDVLQEAGINYTGNERISVNGSTVSDPDAGNEIEDGDRIAVFTPKEAGSL